MCSKKPRSFVMLKENVLMLIPLILDGQNQTDKPLNNCKLKNINNPLQKRKPLS